MKHIIYDKDIANLIKEAKTCGVNIVFNRSMNGAIGTGTCNYKQITVALSISSDTMIWKMKLREGIHNQLELNNRLQIFDKYEKIYKGE